MWSPIEWLRGASSTIASAPVFVTERSIKARSRLARSSQRGSMTSTSIPSAAELLGDRERPGEADATRRARVTASPSRTSAPRPRREHVVELQCRHLAGDATRGVMLDHEHRVLADECGIEQAYVLRRRRGCRDPPAREEREERGGIAAVLGPETASLRRPRADDDRDGQPHRRRRDGPSRCG